MNLKKSQILGYNLGHKASLLIGDIAVLMLAFYVASKVRVNLVPNFLSTEFISLALITIGCIFIGNGYASNALARAPKLPFRTFFIVIASSIPSTIFIYFIGVEGFTYLFGRGIFPVAIVLMGFLSIINRVIVNQLIFKKPTLIRTVAILGETDSRNWLSESLTKARFDVNCQYYSRLEDIGNTNIAALVITPSYKPDQIQQQKLISRRLSGTPIFSLHDFIEKFLFLIPVQEISDDWFIRSEGFTMLHSSIAHRIKRASDIIASLGLFLVTIPITCITVALIKRTSPGPVFFSQTRVGMNGKPFTVYKFRTMHINAETTGAQWASENDPRIITGGNFLRKTRIDEIPQCWNILKGEMSFIGPRPERPEFTSMLNKEVPYYDLRHIIKPGLTGWAQVKYPYGASTEDSLRKLQFDLYYIKNYSLLLDLNIVIRTIKITLLRGGR